MYGSPPDTAECRYSCSLVRYDTRHASSHSALVVLRFGQQQKLLLLPVYSCYYTAAIMIHEAKKGTDKESTGHASPSLESPPSLTGSSFSLVRPVVLYLVFRKTHIHTPSLACISSPNYPKQRGKIALSVTYFIHPIHHCNLPKSNPLFPLFLEEKKREKKRKDRRGATLTLYIASSHIIFPLCTSVIILKRTLFPIRIIIKCLKESTHGCLLFSSFFTSRAYH